MFSLFLGFTELGSRIVGTANASMVQLGTVLSQELFTWHQRGWLARFCGLRLFTNSASIKEAFPREKMSPVHT
jgi:hypothetical protein